MEKPKVIFNEGLADMQRRDRNGDNTGWVLLLGFVGITLLGFVLFILLATSLKT